MSIEGVRRIDANRLEIPKDYKTGMRTKGIIYVDNILEAALEQSLAFCDNMA